MVDRFMLDGSSLAKILSDSSSPAFREIEAARDAILEAVGPEVDNFSDPEYIERDLLPSLFDTFMTWQSTPILETDYGVYARFALSVRRYVDQLKGVGYFRHAAPSMDYMEKTYARVVARGPKYSSIPPIRNAMNGIAIPIAPPPGLIEEEARLEFMVQVVTLAGGAIDAFKKIAGSRIGCSAARAYAGALSEALEMLDDGGIPVEIFLQLLLQEETRVHLRNFTYRFEDWFFGIADEVRGLQNSGMASLEGKGSRLTDDLSLGIVRQFDAAHEWMRLSRAVRVPLETMLKMDIGAPYREGWRRYMLNAPMLAHDFAGPVMSIQLAASSIRKVIHDPDTAITAEDLNEITRSFDASSTAALVEMVHGMVERDASDADIGVILGRMDDVRIPRQYRSDLFRMVREFARNAVKCYDGTKENRYIRFESIGGRDQHVIEVEDNGVGIEDVERAMTEWGYRENPARTRGTGAGLPHKVKLAEELGWRIEIESELGKFTKARVIIDNSEWDGSPSGPDGRGEGEGPTAPDSDATPAEGASSAAADAITRNAIQAADLLAGAAVLLGYVIA